MINSNIETFMSEYFLIKAVLGKHLGDGKKLFRQLGAIFLIPEADADRLYSLAENETARDINTEKEFMQYRRLQKYSQILGAERQDNAEWEEIVKIKGSAILTAQEYNLVPDAEASRNMVYTYLSAAAGSGAVIAMRIMGILQCEGIFLDKNEKAGLKNLSKAGDWNDCISLLALLYYRKDNREYNMARLKQSIADTPFSKLYDTAAEKYPTADGIDVSGVKLLYKAFNSGVLKRETYEPKYARVLNSKALYIKDKEKAVFNPNKEQITVIGDLPLKLKPENISAVETDGVQSVVLNREQEVTFACRALKNGDLRILPSYRPLCVCSDSGYVLNLYAKAISAKTKDVHTEKIDVAELSEYDFEPTSNNIFVRSIDEDKDNRFLLFFRGEISEKKIDAVKSFLQSARRAKFHLNAPGVTLNLSAVLPICFCDRKNADLLKPYCDIITIAPVTADEMPRAIDGVIISKQKLYGVGDVKLSGKASDIFAGYDIDTAEEIIDSAIRARREKGAEITLTRELVQEYAPDNCQPVMGFGGLTNERNR